MNNLLEQKPAPESATSRRPLISEETARDLRYFVTFCLMLTTGIISGVVCRPALGDHTTVIFEISAVIMLATAPLMYVYGRFTWFSFGMLYLGVVIGIYLDMLVHGFLYGVGWLMFWFFIHFG